MTDLLQRWQEIRREQRLQAAEGLLPCMHDLLGHPLHLVVRLSASATFLRLGGQSYGLLVAHPHQLDRLLQFVHHHHHRLALRHHCVLRRRVHQRPPPPSHLDHLSLRHHDQALTRQSHVHRLHLLPNHPA